MVAAAVGAGGHCRRPRIIPLLPAVAFPLCLRLAPSLLRDSTPLKPMHISTGWRRFSSRGPPAPCRRRRRVVVTGLGAITPLGPDLASTWRAVLRTRNDSTPEHQNSGITTLKAALGEQNLSPAQFAKEWEALQNMSCQVAASVPNEWIVSHPRAGALEGEPPSWLDGRTSRFVQLALIAAREAVHQSGLHEWLGCGTQQHADHAVQQRRDHIGVSIGNGMSSTRDVSIASSQPVRRISPHFVPRVLPNSPAARVAIDHHLRGPNLTHSEACAAGAAAIAHAFEMIESGRVQGMVAGGCESALDVLGFAGFSRLRALSSGGDVFRDETDEGYEEDTAQLASRPFDARRSGFVLAEGAAMLVLEEHDAAVARGAPILGEILGVGYSGDAFHITAPEPTGEGAARAMLQAAEGHGGMHAVDYVNAHATSTPIGDRAEVHGIRLALSRAAARRRDENQATASSPLLVSSTKGATGHLLGAAGAVEAALTVRAVAEDTAPHTRNLEDVPEDVARTMQADDASRRAIHLVRGRPMSRVIHTAMSNSFGFGGTNVSLLFGKVSSTQ